MPTQFFYHIIILKQKSPLLTYVSKTPLEIGRIVKVSLLKKEVQGFVFKECEEPDFKCKEAIAQDFYFAKEQIALAEFIASYYFSSYAQTFGIFTPFKRGSISKLESLSFTLKPLNTEQKKALDFINLRQETLLFGDTGSGKTEIYIHLLNQALNKKMNALFLMPEIALTPQMEKRLRAVFGDCLAFWHSKVTKAKKEKILQGLQEGRIRILAGARSALFLPLLKCGVIIIDEEHDDAYKSNTNPRYHARDIALYYAKMQKIKIILGSATPLATTYYRTKEKNAIFRLKGTYFNTQKHYNFCESAESLNFNIFEALKDNLKDAKQAIVFLPTRANFKHLLCKDCAKSVECPNCSVSLSLHSKDKSLRCHYCHYTMPLLQVCPSCKGELQSLRIGTQEFSKELQHFLSAQDIQVNIACFDRDAITTQNKLTQTLNAFNAHKIDILVGTQMLSKGHDYHNVALSVILGLDYILKGCDYRAREKALALMLQISGRSGRKEDGKVLIQTLNKDFLIHYLHDYDTFLEDELRVREDLYPPFMRLALVHLSHKKEESAKELLQQALAILQEKIAENTLMVEIVGSGEAPILRIANKFRYRIMLRSKSAKDIHNALLALRNFACEIDMDPIAFN